MAIDLRQYDPQPHPLNEFFKSLGVRKVSLANFLGLSPSRLSHLLLGYCPIPADIEAKLQKLAQDLQEANQAAPSDGEE